MKRSLPTSLLYVGVDGRDMRRKGEGFVLNDLKKERRTIWNIVDIDRTLTYYG